MGPPASMLVGRNLGMDFEVRDGFRMYHGEVVPGFPQHPHRGFETVTIARRGFIDHSDSLGAAARFGRGDVQWLTAGRGIVHSEMFPLVKRDSPNPVELFQIWLNLPAEDKLAEPCFSMLWANRIPRHTARDDEGRVTEVDLVAGKLGALVPPAPPPRSWASRSDTDVAIWTIRMQSGASVTLPETSVSAGTVRTLYFFAGQSLRIADRAFRTHAAIRVAADRPLELRAGESDCEILLLQGRPIGEPVVQHGPFVMNRPAEIQQAIVDYRRTGFGGWPWPTDDPVHPREQGRFARHADGHVERPLTE
ncbi:MAG: pirin family protein [Deltaproteobacteria bacterium]|nr:pirin family protein [Deltaproteobacteria bacterium]